MQSLRSRPELTAALGGLFLLCWGLVHLDLWSRHAIVDWPTYERYGDAILHQGLVPYRDFAVEYPPGALVAFILPGAFGDYASAFAWQMAACGVVLVAVVAAIGARRTSGVLRYVLVGVAACFGAIAAWSVGFVGFALLAARSGLLKDAPPASCKCLGQFPFGELVTNREPLYA